nr:MAG TPA: Repressor protein CI [Caudoviricetes sp.]
MAENIQRLMNNRGIDRNKICADLGFKYTTFTDWVKGKTYPRIDKIELMANYFGVPKSHLIESQDIIDLFNTKKAKIAIDALVQIATSHEAIGDANLHGKKFAAEILSKALIECLKSDNKGELIKLAAIIKFTGELKLINLKDFIINQYYDADIALQFKEYVEKEMNS